MLDGAAVLAKTPKGLEEVKSRSHGVPQKLRTLLIMVDGTATVAEILGRFPGIAEIETNLQVLVDGGFVSVAGGAPPAPTTASGAESPAAGAPPAAPPVPASRDEALRVLARKLYDTLGPDAEFVTGDLEGAKSRADYDRALARALRMLEGTSAARGKGFRDFAAAVRDRHFAG